MTAAEEEEREANRKHKFLNNILNLLRILLIQNLLEMLKNGPIKMNGWSDRIMTSAAFQIHQDLLDQGFDVESQEYYNEIDKTMKDNFPHKFNRQEPKKIVQTVASAQRNQNGRRSVKLTRSQIAIAKKLGCH